MKKALIYAGAALTSAALALLPATKAKGDIINFGNLSTPGSGIGGTYNTVDNGYAAGGSVTPGYDPGVDGLLDTSINPNDQFFVTYIPMIDSTGGDVAVDFNKSTFPQVGDTYTARLSFENRIPGRLRDIPNTIKFDNYTITQQLPA